MKEKKNDGKFTALDFKTYCNVAVIKTMWYWSVRIDQQNITEFQNISSHVVK